MRIKSAFAALLYTGTGNTVRTVPGILCKVFQNILDLQGLFQKPQLNFIPLIITLTQILLLLQGTLFS